MLERFEGLRTALAIPGATAAIRLTLITSTLAALINAVMGTMLAYVLVRFSFPGKRLLSAVVDLLVNAAGEVVHLTDGSLWLLGVGRLSTHGDLASSLETDPGAPPLPLPGTSGMALARPRQGGGRLIVSSHPFSLPAPSGPLAA